MSDERTAAVEVLVVEDSPTQAAQLRHLLESDGWRVTVAANAPDAMQILGTWRPALVITDIVMPGMSGYDLCRWVKAEPGLEQIPVVLLTSLAGTDDVLDGLAAGADGLITKPYQPTYLLASLARTLDKRQRHPSVRAQVEVDVTYRGTSRLVHADAQQMLTLLLSTYDAAVSRNEELVVAQDALRTLNRRLGSLVDERTAKLQARVWELDCLHAISDLVAHPGGTIERVLQAAADMIPGQGRLPDAVGVRITLDGRAFTSDGFRETARWQSSGIEVAGERAGLVEIAYPEDGSALARADLPRETQDLIDDVARQLGVMVERRRAEASIRALNEDLEGRVRERTAWLEAANRDLEAFSYSVSHDLRSPARAINGFASRVRRRGGDLADPENERLLDNIIESSQHMGVLIEELLEYSRLGRGQVRREPVPLEPILERLTTTFAERIAATGTTLELATPLAVPLGDPLLVEQILANLLDNALTYRRTDVTPQVTIAAVRGGDTVALSIADNGIGIAQAHQEKIFEVFARLHRDDEYPGTGIGLATVRKSARLMGSDVTLTSVEGEGTTFTFVLPAAEAGGGR